MLSIRKQAWIMAAGVAGLLGTGAFSSAQAGSAVQWGEFSASSSDKLTAGSMDVGGAYADTEGALNAAYATHDFYRLSAAQANTILDEVLASASQWQAVAQRCAIGQAEIRRMASAFGLFE